MYMRRRNTEKELIERELLAYYKYLYENYEMKSVSEIANYLDMHVKTVRSFIRKYFNGQSANGKFSTLDIMILTSTKFSDISDNSIYIEEQRKLNKLIIYRKLQKLMNEQENQEKLNEENQKLKKM